MAQEARTARDRLDRIFSIARRTLRFWAAGLLVLLVGGGASVAYAMLKPRVYKSETLILYREGIRASDLGGPEQLVDPARKLGLRLKEMVFSRTSLQKIIDEFKLYPSTVSDRGYVDAVDEMRGHISFRVKDGDTFGLSFEDSDAKRVQEVTQRLAESLLGANTRSRSEQVEVTKEFLDQERQRIETDFKTKETNLAKFLAKHPEFARENAAAAAARATAPKPTGKASDATLLALEREASRIQERLGTPPRKRSKEEPQPDARLVADQKAAEQELAAAQKEVTEKLAQFTDKHPDVVAARSRQKAAEQRVKRAQDAVASDVAGASGRKGAPEDDEGIIDRGTLENELRKVQDEITAHRAKLKAREASKEAAAEGVSTGAQMIVALETDWARLNRDVAEARERNQQVQDKQFKASITESAVASGRSAQMVIVDPAYKPTHPTRLGTNVIVGFGVAASIVFALLVLISLALLDEHIYDRVDIERLRIMPLLSVVPRASTRKGARG